MVDISNSTTLPGRDFSNIGFGAEGIEERFTLNLCISDYDFLDTLKLEMASGRSGGYYTNNENYISIRMNTGNIVETRKYVEKTWKSFVPNMPFEYSFLDQDYDNLYINERQTRKLFAVFSVLALLIALLIVSIQTVKAALRSPVDSLRYE